VPPGDAAELRLAAWTAMRGGGATATAVLNEGRGRGAVARGDRDPVKGQSEADIFS